MPDDLASERPTMPSPSGQTAVVDWRCVICRRHYAKNEPDRTCSECRRHLAYGVLVDVILGMHRHTTGEYNALDALSTVMGTATRLRRQHNKDMFEEQRAAQRGAREAYEEGRYSSREW